MSFVMPNTIANGATRDARPVQANFAAISSALQNDYVRADGSIAATSQLTQASAPTNDSHLTNKAYVDALIPVGVVVDYGGGSAPSGWLLCQGQLVSKATYPLLWALLGDTYGASTGTQFYLPDLRNRVAVGVGSDFPLAEKGGSKDAVVVSHAHGNTFSADAVAGGAHDHNIGNNTQLWFQGAAGGFGGWTPGVGNAQVTGYWNGTGYTTTYNATAAGHHDHAVNLSGGVSSAGVSGTNANLQPYIVLNKIIRVG